MFHSIGEDESRNVQRDPSSLHAIRLDVSWSYNSRVRVDMVGFLFIPGMAMSGKGRGRF